MKKVINFGSLNIDHVYQVPHFVKPGETLSSTAYNRFCGGKGSNQSIALAKAGAEVYHAGCIGHDGDFLKTNLKDNGVHTDFVKTVGQPSGHAIIQIDPNGENAIILFPGANETIPLEMIDDVFSQTSPGDLLLLQNEINNLALIMEKAAEKGLDIALNFAPFSAETAKHLPLHLLKILIINETEGEGLASKKQPDEIIATLTTQYPDMMIVLTLGADGAICSYKNQLFKASAKADKVVDTTCAGDTFIGFFLAAYLEDKSLDICLRDGCKAGAISVSRAGASVSIPLKAELMD